jgi:RNA polymerase sigma-70 factor (ECF subfamily)
MADSPGQLGEEAFMRLVLNSERELQRYVMAIVPDREDARDIVQETLISLWKKRDRYDPSRPFVPWACRFAANEIRMLRRRRKRWRWIASEELIDLLLARREELSGQLDERHEQLQKCLGKLPERQRTAIARYYFHEEAVPQVADRLSTSAEAIYKILQRARQYLFDCITRGLVAKGGTS